MILFRMIWTRQGLKVAIGIFLFALVSMVAFFGISKIDKGPTEEFKAGLCPIQPWEHTWQLNLVSGGKVQEALNFMGSAKVHESGGCIFWTPAAQNQRVYCGEFYLEELTKDFYIECATSVWLPKAEESDVEQSN